MNNKFSQSTQLKLLQIMSEITKNKEALSYVKENHYLGGYAYDLGEVIGKLEVALKCLNFDVLKLDEDN